MSLPLRFRLHPRASTASIWKVIEGRRIGSRNFTPCSGSTHEKVAIGVAVTDIVDSGCLQFTGQAMADFFSHK